MGYGRPGFAYYMEMGLGKTLTILTEFGQLVSERKCTRLVVVCPNSFKTGWVEEIAKHELDFDTCIYNSGSDTWRNKWIRTEFSKPPVLIINYEAIRTAEARGFVGQFTEGRECMLVIDESIQIKTYDSLQTKGVLKISPLFKYQRVLSGKPVTTGPHDLWAQMKAIGVMSTNYFPFKTTFCKMGGFKGKKVVGSQNEELLADRINQHIFRASKADWTDLPPKLYTSRQYKLTPVIERHYKSMENDFVVWLNETDIVSVDTFITKYIKLLQIQSGFIIRENGDVDELVRPHENTRFRLVQELIEEATGKVVIPYIHRYTLNILLVLLSQYRPAVIKGGMEPAEIQEHKDRFNNDSECRIILVQTRAGKYGHTLLGGSDPLDRCSTMVFAENSYSLDDRSQIEDRIHRHGQTAESCLYVDLWGTSLDHRVTQALQAKEDISQAVFSYFGVQSSV
jgi:SNF2 family DNA or RNA helicase